MARLAAQISRMPVEPYDTVAGPTLFEGRLAIVSAGRVQPYEAADIPPDDLPILAIIAFLQDGTGLPVDILTGNAPDVQLVADCLASDPRLAAIALKDFENAPLGSLQWAPPRSGETLFHKALPVSLGLIIFML